MGRTMKLFIMIMTTLVLLGCASDTQRVNNEFRANQPLEYKQGYIDGEKSGCDSVGNPWYKVTKDLQRYADDSLYKQGWDDGFSAGKCASSAKDVQKGITIFGVPF
jgi:hypothetical protein